jgi:hypothetical protein
MERASDLGYETLSSMKWKPVDILHNSVLYLDREIPPLPFFPISLNMEKGQNIGLHYLSDTDLPYTNT